jgi:hypothetical protein
MNNEQSTLNNPEAPAEVAEGATLQPRFRPVGKRVAIRAVGMSAQDEAKLVELQNLLSDDSGDGKPSVSLVVRKALERFHLQILGIRKDPESLASEVSQLHVKAKRLNRGKRRQSHRLGDTSHRR